jgi:hypothetical protein
MDFHEIWYWSDATDKFCKLKIFNFLQSLILKRRVLEIVRWNDGDAIAPFHLRMRITNLT